MVLCISRTYCDELNPFMSQHAQNVNVCVDAADNYRIQNVNRDANAQYVTCGLVHAVYSQAMKNTQYGSAICV